jgi:hypothetical protein
MERGHKAFGSVQELLQEFERLCDEARWLGDPMPANYALEKLNRLCGTHEPNMLHLMNRLFPPGGAKP